MKIRVEYVPRPRAFGTHGDSALQSGADLFVVPTDEVEKAILWIRHHPNYTPQGRSVRFFLEDGTEVTPNA